MVRTFFVISSLCLALSACDMGPDSPRGFSLPKGNSDAGKAAFLKHGCINCHSVDDVKVAKNHIYHIPKAVPLGGSSGAITTYGELVTSIINPSHKLTRRQPVSFTSEDGTSLMRDVNDVLTVSELIDLVAYLQPKYKVVPYRTSEYRLYQLRMPDKTTTP